MIAGVAEARVERRHDHRHRGGEDASAARATTGNSSHVHVGSTPAARMNTNTTTRFSPRLNSAVSTTASGITSARELRLADHRLLGHDRADSHRRRLLEEAEQHDVEQQQHRILVDALAEVERLREDEQQHAEQQQRTGERPHVAERRAEVAAAELGDRDQVQQVERRGASRRRAPTGRGPRAARARASLMARASPPRRRRRVTLPFPRPRCRRRRSRTAAAGAARCPPARGCRAT